MRRRKVRGSGDENGSVPEWQGVLQLSPAVNVPKLSAKASRVFQQLGQSGLDQYLG